MKDLEHQNNQTTHHLDRATNIRQSKVSENNLCRLFFVWDMLHTQKQSVYNMYTQKRSVVIQIAEQSNYSAAITAPKHCRIYINSLRNTINTLKLFTQKYIHKKNIVWHSLRCRVMTIICCIAGFCPFNSMHSIPHQIPPTHSQ